MTLKERVEEHWLIRIVAVAIASGGVTATVILYVSSVTHENKLIDLELDHKRELAEIQHELQKTQDQFQFATVRFKGDTMKLRSYVQPKSAAQRPPHSKEFGPGQFYAADSIGQWRHSTPNPPPVAKPFDSSIIGTVMEQLESFPATTTHTWVGGKPDAVTGSKVLANVYPFIAVKRAATQDWRTGLASFWKSGQNAWALAILLGVPRSQIISSMQTLSEVDLRQVIFLFEFCKRQLAAIVDSSISFETLALQTQDDTLHARFLTTYTNITVDGIRTENFYVREMLMVIPTRKDLFVISTFWPSDEHGFKDELDGTSDWFSQLVIFNEPP